MAVVFIHPYIRSWRVYRAHAPCSRILQDLRRVSPLNARWEWRKRWLWRAHWVVVFTAWALVPVFLLVRSSREDASILPLLSLFLLLFVSPALLALWYYHPGPELDRRRHELVQRVLTLLQADIAPDQPVRLRLDLRPENLRQKFRGVGQTPSGWSVRHFLDPWLDLRGRFVDGTHFRVGMKERVERRMHQRRVDKPRKVRIKEKHRRVSDAFVRVRLYLKPERYPHLARLGEKAKKAIVLPAGARLHALHVQQDLLDLSVHVELRWDGDPLGSSGWASGPEVVAAAFLGLYQLLVPTRVPPPPKADPPPKSEPPRKRARR